MKRFILAAFLGSEQKAGCNNDGCNLEILLPITFFSGKKAGNGLRRQKITPTDAPVQ